MSGNRVSNWFSSSTAPFLNLSLVGDVTSNMSAIRSIKSMKEAGLKPQTLLRTSTRFCGNALRRPSVQCIFASVRTEVCMRLENLSAVLSNSTFGTRFSRIVRRPRGDTSIPYKLLCGLLCYIFDCNRVCKHSKLRPLISWNRTLVRRFSPVIMFRNRMR
jgi:hypothetical protein